MSRFEVVEARAYHCGQMARLLRAEHLNALQQTGLNLHREFRATFDQSSFRRAWLIDGRLAAIGGVTGMTVSCHGMIWLAVTDEAARHKIAMVREARRQIAQITETKRFLAATIIDGDLTARRFAVFLGFHVDEEGPGKRAFTRAGRRVMHHHLETTPCENRVPTGRIFSLAMGYHEDDD